MSNEVGPDFIVNDLSGCPFKVGDIIRYKESAEPSAMLYGLGAHNRLWVDSVVPTSTQGVWSLLAKSKHGKIAVGNSDLFKMDTPAEEAQPWESVNKSWQYEVKNKQAEGDMPEEALLSLFTEEDPFGIPAHAPGSKLDKGKSPVFQGAMDYFPRAIKAVADVSAFGAAKYTWKGWATVADGENRYRNALVRHLLEETSEGTFDKDGMIHRAQVAWNALASLELMLQRWEREGKGQGYEPQDIVEFRLVPKSHSVA